MADIYGRKTGGRKAGSKNVFSATVKDNILAVFNRLGGAASMAEWARKNETEFYKLYARLIPSDTGSRESTEYSVKVITSVQPVTDDSSRV
jgi:hypothetical protein